MADSLLIAPSILSADFGRLTEEVQEVQAAGADWVHVDVMDGRFVPNISVGLPVVKAVRRATQLPVDVHLMIVEPERYLEAFADAGADIIALHVEACTHVQRALAEIRRLGKRAGVVLNPDTHESCLEYLLDDIDLVLIMSVNPGFSGQKYLASQESKLTRVREMITASGKAIDLQVDGGISPQTIGSAKNAGANVFVAGASVFGQPDRRAAISALRSAAR